MFASELPFFLVKSVKSCEIPCFLVFLAGQIPWFFPTATPSTEAAGPADAYRRISNGALRVSCLRNCGALAIESEDLLRSLLVTRSEVEPIGSDD